MITVPGSLYCMICRAEVHRPEAPRDRGIPVFYCEDCKVSWRLPMSQVTAAMERRGTHPPEPLPPLTDEQIRGALQNGLAPRV